MVKLFKKGLNQSIESIRRTPTLIELQTFTNDAVRIINDRPLTTVSDQPNHLAPITPSSFVGQSLSPNTPSVVFTREIFEKIFFIMLLWHIGFG